MRVPLESPQGLEQVLGQDRIFHKKIVLHLILNMKGDSGYEALKT